MVFQNYALYPHLTVRQNLEFGLRMRKVPASTIAPLVESTARMLELSDLLERRPRQLSGGQRQRVAVGRAVVRQPSAFLFDEPLSNLDAKLRVQMRAELVRLQAQLQTTALYVTHDQVEAMTMGHRLAVLDRGKLQQVGTPLEVYRAPGERVRRGIHRHAADEPGARHADGGRRGRRAWCGRRRRRSADSAHPNGWPRPPRRAGATDVVAGIRPEDLRPPRGAADRGGRGRITVRAELLEALGHETVVYARAGETRLTAKLPPTDRMSAGDLVELEVAPESVHLFDARSGLRLDE